MICFTCHNPYDVVSFLKTKFQYMGVNAYSCFLICYVFKIFLLAYTIKPAFLMSLYFLLQVQGMHSDTATLRKASIWREASRIISEEGFRAFWKGNLVTIAHRLPYSSVNFYAYEHYKKVSMNN